MTGFHGNEAKKNFFKNKSKMAETKENEVFNSANSQYIFSKNLMDWSLDFLPFCELMSASLMTIQVVPDQCSLHQSVLLAQG